MLNLEQGEKLVELARKTVERWFKEKKFTLEKVDDKTLKEKRGVFVTIENFPSKNLRSCIGIPGESLKLYEAVQRAAFSSAFEDPRFPPLKKEELNKVIFEISILTKLKLIEVKDPKEYFEKIEIGKDGLMLINKSFSGLLLPNVPIQFNWVVEEFLENLCYKANLTPDWVYDKDTKIWKFQTQIFAEEKPNGKIVEVKLPENK